METFAIYSAGGFGREIKSAFVQSQSLISENKFEVVFIDDGLKSGDVVNGCRVISFEEALSLDDLRISVAFADPKLRKSKVEQCEAAGCRFFSIFAPSFIKYDDVTIGKGAIIADNTMVTANAKIGSFFHCGIYSYVTHDCIVGDFVTLTTRVSLNGRIKVEDGVFIGSGVSFLPGKPDKFLTIGEGAIIGAGALVTKDVEPYSTVIGSPAKAIKRG